MEFYNIGEQCSVQHCRQLDFLPFKCEGCKETFCLEHRTMESHKCSSPITVLPKTAACPICSVVISVKDHNLLDEKVRNSFSFLFFLIS